MGLIDPMPPHQSEPIPEAVSPLKRELEEVKEEDDEGGLKASIVVRPGEEDFTESAD